MAKVRKGRVFGVVLVLGGVAWGISALTSDDDTVETAAEQEAEVATEEVTEPPAEEAPAAERTPSRTEGAATSWAERSTQVASLLEDHPGFVVHRMKTYPNGTLRLECSGAGSNLRQVAVFRDGLKNHPLGRSSTLESSSVQIRSHNECDLHGEVKDVMLFNLDLVPYHPASSPIEPGSLRLVAGCDGID